MANNMRRSLPDVWSGGGRVGPSRGMAAPLREFSRLQRNIDRMFEDLLSPVAALMVSDDEDITFSPAVDIDETDTHYVLAFDLPGVAKDNVRIEVRDNQLVVSGERKEEHATRVSRERFYGMFQRVIQLPSNVNPEQVEANFQDGVLRVAIPKAEASRARQIPIKENEGGILGRLLGGQRKDSAREPARESARQTKEGKPDKAA